MRFTVYHPVTCLSFSRPQCETFVYFLRVRKKTSEADCSFGTIDTAINLTYCLLLLFLDRLGGFAQPFQRMLLSTAVFLSYFFMSDQWNTHSPLGLIGGNCCAQSRGMLLLAWIICPIFSCKTPTLFWLGDVSLEMHCFHLTPFSPPLPYYII